MNGRGAWRASLFPGVALSLSATLLLGACSHNPLTANNDDGSGADAYPANYKADILGAMHVYLSDPTGIRDAAIAAPALKEVGGETRYIACVKFNPKRNDTDYAGIKELAALFLAGRFDHFIDASKEQCGGAAYAPFPELQKLPP